MQVHLVALCCHQMNLHSLNIHGMSGHQREAEDSLNECCEWISTEN